MNKRLMALAVAGALAAPLAASAEGTHVTIFGRLQAEYATVDIDGFNAQTAVADDALQSRWGLQIAEDLGAGLRAIGRIEYSLNPGGGEDRHLAREQWVGLGGDQWGELKFGRVQSVLKDFAGGHTIDPFAYTSLHANGSGGLMASSDNGYGSGDHGFVNSAVRFDSPVVEGFSVAGLLMPGDADKNDPTRDPSYAGGENGEWDFQVAAKYSGQFDAVGVDVFGAYSRDNVSKLQKSLGASKDEQIWRGGAIISVGDFRLRGQYERVYNANPYGGAASCTHASSFGDAVGPYSQDFGRGQCNSAMNPNGNGDLWIAGADYTIGNTMLIAQGGMATAKKTGDILTLDPYYAKRNVENITVGVIHNLSRRSSLFGGYQRVWVKDRNAAVLGMGDADRNVYSVGVRHDF
ncbi:porin [Nitrosomonas europaea]|uniref:porin n=1 Tax=Nitrosomonas europaea TaxID=915 RepID=UPI0032666D96